MTEDPSRRDDEAGVRRFPAGRRATMSNRHLRRLQRRHFVLFDVMPFVVTLVALASLPWLPIGRVEVGLFLAFWLMTGLGLTVGFHRFFSHRAFETPRPVAVLLIVLGSMAGRGSMISWAAMHRRHHEKADMPGDLHSPMLHGEDWRGRLRGFAHAHLTWMLGHDYPNVAVYAPDLMREPAFLWANRHYHLWVVLGLALPALAGGLLTESGTGLVTGLLWGGFVRLFVVEQTMSCINSLFHRVGRRAFATRGDNSRNVIGLGLVSWGEAWHNNHHAFPFSAAFGLRWFELDPGFWFIRLLALLGLASNVKVADARMIARRDRQAQDAAAMMSERS